MRSVYSALFATAFAVASVACQKTDAPGEDKPAVSLNEVAAELKELEARFGEDAYTQPEVDEILRKLADVDPDSEDRIEAVKLSDLIRAKRKLAWQVQVDERVPDPPENALQLGPKPMEGDKPADDGKLAAAEKIDVGATRVALVEAYGSCLIRQTWFPGKEGGSTTELFHVAKECREKLTPRVFTVAAGVVKSVAPGNLDAVMTGAASHARRGEEG